MCVRESHSNEISYLINFFLLLELELLGQLFASLEEPSECLVANVFEDFE